MNGLLKNKRILLISPETWGVNRVSKHHYAALLGSLGNTVHFLSPAVEVDGEQVAPGVHLLPSPQLAKGVRFYPSFARRAYHKKLGVRIASLAGGAFDLVWSFEASRYIDLDALAPGAKSILYLADRNDALPWRQVAASADLCLSVSHAIVNELRPVSKSAHFIQHGYNPVKATPFAFDTPGPNVVYAGSLIHKTLDRELIGSLMTAYPSFSFHFFGETGMSNLGSGSETDFVKLLRTSPNAKVHGPVVANLLPGIYENADALLVPYKRGFDQLGNPHKMMEYLASGTPILSTRLAEYREIEAFIVMKDDTEDYIKALKSVINDKSKTHETKRKAFAANNTYEKQLVRIMGFLNKESTNQASKRNQ